MKKNEYIEFEIKNENKFKDLKKLFELISESKKNEDYKSDEFWFGQFPDYALEKYCFNDSDLKPKFPTADPNNSSWHFYSMIEHLLENLDVELLTCKKIGNEKGRIEFYAFGYPYGGITGMTMFLKSFGFKATKIDEGGGVYQVNWKNETEFELVERKTQQNKFFKLKLTNSEIKSLTGIAVLILLADIFLMKYWVSTINPDPFMSIGVESYRPRIIGINILIGIIVFIFRKRFSLLFFVNTIVCYWIFLFFWNTWLENHPFSQTKYNFKVDNKSLQLRISKNPNTYSIYKLNPTSIDSIEIIQLGMNRQKGDSLELSSMEGTMYVYKNKLIGFPGSPHEIELHKPEFVKMSVIYRHNLNIDLKWRQKVFIKDSLIDIRQAKIDIYFSKKVAQIPYYLPTNGIYKDSIKDKECDIGIYPTNVKCYQYDNENRVQSMNVSGSGTMGTWSYKYDKQDRIIEIEYLGNRYTIQYHEKHGLLKEIVKDLSGNLEERVEFKYN